MRRLLPLVALFSVHLVLAAQSAPPPPAKSADDYSGTYSFLQDGEFVEVTVEDEGKVTGFVSRYGDKESDRGAFLDHFFKDGKLDEKKLTFTTQTVHGVWYEFKGTVDRGDGKTLNDEGYYVLKGTLVQSTTDARGKVTTQSRDVAFKSFPRNLDSEPEKKN
jgi:hypothetical protein